MQGHAWLALYPDYMHCKALGTDQYFYGTVIVMIAVTFLTGPSDARLETILEKVKDYHRTHGGHSLTGLSWSRLSIGSLESLGTTGYPLLKAKADETSSCGPALLSIWSELMNRAIETQVQVEEALRHCVEMDVILRDNKHEPCLSPPEAAKFRTACFGFLRLQNSLHDAAAANNFPFFNVTVKSHYIAHIALRAHLLNPVFGWCYAGEDFMQKVKSISLRCMQGVSTHQVPFKIVEKYLRGLCVMFDRESFFQ